MQERYRGHAFQLKPRFAFGGTAAYAERARARMYRARLRIYARTRTQPRSEAHGGVGGHLFATITR